MYDFVEIHKFPGPSVFFSFQSPMKMLKILQYGQANTDLVVGYRLGGGFLADKNGNVVFRYFPVYEIPKFVLIYFEIFTRKIWTTRIT